MSSILRDLSLVQPPIGSMGNSSLASTCQKTGTTIVALRTDTFCIIGSDQQGTLFNKAFYDTKKVYKISDYLVFAGAGLAAQCGYYATYLKYLYLKLEKRLDLQKSIEPLLVYLRTEIMRTGGLDSIFMIASKTITGQYMVYVIDGIGSYSQVPYFSVGSGGDLANGILSSSYKKDLTEAEGLSLVTKAIETSKSSDLYSGGKSHCFLLKLDKTIELLFC